MTVYFQGSEAEALWPNPNLGTYLEGAPVVEGAWSRTGVAINGGGYNAYVEAKTGTNLTRWWIHAVNGRTNANALNGFDGSSLSLYTSGGAEAVRIWHGKGGEVLQLQYKNGGVWVDVGEVFDFHGIQRWDMRFELGNGTTTDDILEMYRDEILVASKRQVNFLRALFPLGVSYARFYSIPNIAFQPSQVIIADEETLDWKCKTIVPNSNGADVDGLGAVGDVNEQQTDNNTFVTFDTAGQHRSFKALERNLTNKVKAFTVAGRIRLVEETLPNKIKPYVRPAGAPTRYYGTTFTLTLGYLDYEYTWNVNPQTGVAWTTSEINNANLEFGWEVVGG